MSEDLIKNHTNSNYTYNIKRPVPLIAVQITVVLGGLLSLIGILANIYVLHIIRINKDMRSPSYYGLVNLSIANLLTAIFYPLPPVFILVTSVIPVQNSRLLTYVVCGFILPLSVTALNVANGTLAFMAVSKYYSINSDGGSGRKLTNRKAIGILICLWFAACMLHWPRTIIVMPKSYIAALCTIYINDNLSRNMMLIFASITILGPFAIMLICHIQITKKLKQRHRFFLSAAILKELNVQSFTHGGSSTRTLNNAIQMLRQVTLMQFFCCLICTLAFYVSVLSYMSKLNSYVVGFSFTVIYVSAVATGLHGPVLYIFHLKKFRQPLQSFFTSVTSRSSISNLSPQK